MTLRLGPTQRRTLHRALALRASICLTLCLALLGLITTNAASARADAAPAGLVLWNTLGSADEVLDSAFGPDLGFFDPNEDCVIVECAVAYQATPAFPAGVFGGALSIGPGDYEGGVSRVHNVVLRNAASVVNTEQGTVEVWFRQTESGIPYLYGDYRVFDGAYGFSPGIVFGTNDLVGDGHFVFQYGLQFGGEDVEAHSLVNGEIGYDISAHNGEWIHIAGVWDRSGIAGSSDTLRLYVNGEIVATATENTWGTHVGPLVDIGGGNASEIADKFAIDNLKLWNIARTDFSDRFEEGFGRTISIDIEPFNTRNRINPNGRGKVLVAILSDSAFDAATVKLDSVRFGPRGAAPLNRLVLLVDVNRDRRRDLLVRFSLRDTGIQAGDTEACLDAQTTDGTSLHGCDAIRTRP